MNLSDHLQSANDDHPGSGQWIFAHFGWFCPCFGLGGRGAGCSSTRTPSLAAKSSQQHRLWESENREAISKAAPAPSFPQPFSVPGVRLLSPPLVGRISGDHEWPVRGDHRGMKATFQAKSPTVQEPSERRRLALRRANRFICDRVRLFSECATRSVTRC